MPSSKSKASSKSRREFSGRERSQKRTNIPDWDEDIDSDEEEAAYAAGEALNASRRAQKSSDIGVVSQSRTNGATADDDDDSFFETPEETRVRVAKELLNRMGLGTRDESAIEDTLKAESDRSAQKVHYAVADQVVIGEPRFLRGHTDSVTCVAVSASARGQAVTGSKDCSIILWDLESGSKTVFSGKRNNFDCGGHFQQVLDLCVTDDGRTVLSVGRDRLVRIWDIRASTRKTVADLPGHTKAITGICCEPEGGSRRFFTVSEDKSLKVWSLAARSCLETFYGHTATPSCIDILTPDRPVTAGEDTTVRLWKVANESHLLYQHHNEPVDSVKQLNTHRTLSGSQDGSLCLWSVASRKPLVTVPKAHAGRWITGVGCLPFSDTAFSGSDDGKIRVWKVATPFSDKSLKNGKSKHRTLSNEPGVKKPAVTMTELASKAIPVVGVVNKIVTAQDGQLLLAAVGKEHRLGRWRCIREARNGLLVVPLTNSLATTDPTQAVFDG